MAASLDGKASQSKNFCRVTDRKHLIRLKSVCKSWNNLITYWCLCSKNLSFLTSSWLYSPCEEDQIWQTIHWLYPLRHYSSSCTRTTWICQVLFFAVAFWTCPGWVPWLLQRLAFVCWGLHSAVLCMQFRDKTLRSDSQRFYAREHNFLSFHITSLQSCLLWLCRV